MGATLTELDDLLSGQLLRPTDPEYEQARLCFNLLMQRRPAAIARCESVGDVATVLTFAEQHDLEISADGDPAAER